MKSWFLSVFNAIVAWVNLVVELDQDSEQQDFDFEEFLGWYRTDFFNAINGKWGVPGTPLTYEQKD